MALRIVNTDDPAKLAMDILEQSREQGAEIDYIEARLIADAFSITASMKDNIDTLEELSEDNDGVLELEDEGEPLSESLSDTVGEIENKIMAYYTVCRKRAIKKIKGE